VACPVCLTVLSVATEHGLKVTVTVAGPVSLPNFSIATEHVLTETETVAGSVTDLGLSETVYLWQTPSDHLISALWSRRDGSCGRSRQST
jgi:hypothetical protein